MLDAQTGQVFASRGETKRFDLNNTAAYRYYRLNITAVADAATNSMQLSELRLPGNAPATRKQ